MVIFNAGGGTIVNTAVATSLAALPLNALAMSVHELVKVIAVFLYAVELLVGGTPVVV